MQSVQASEQRSRWQRWGRIVFLGLLLALLQIALQVIISFSDSLWWATLGGSIFFYLLIPGGRHSSRATTTAILTQQSKEPAW